MSNATTNPLVAPILEAQEIVRQGLNGDFSGYASMQRLAGLLCGPDAPEADRGRRTGASARRRGKRSCSLRSER